MQTYLVGGAVRDKLLGMDPVERDWVVVGARAEDLLDQGYQPVGKDFPVFLHPHSKEEYALARTERKQGHGYAGFNFHAAPEVTLEQDLARRDLTINAIAQTDDGSLIDPYNGQQDLKDRVLRHVSPAFIEDPLRVLRVARFAARFAHLGFTVAQETMDLMAEISRSGELDYLVAERTWRELERALGEATPQVFFQVLRDSKALGAILPELDALFGVPQTAKYHPEIDTGIHSLMSLQQASLLSQSSAVRFAALCHDLGKALTPADQLPRHIGHEKSGLKPLRQMCKRIKAPREHAELAALASEYHLHVHRAGELRAETIMKVIKASDGLRRPERFEQFLLACEADSKGRTGHEDNPYPQRQVFSHSLQLCQLQKSQPFAEQGISGKALGQALEQARIDAIRNYQQSEGFPL
jgi:tRNA nucleotidyltransferase (CCA-adding enzyme)